MTDTINNLYEERSQLRKDLLAFKQPKRIPITAKFSPESACGLADIDPRQALFNPALMEQAIDKVCQTFYSDAFPFSSMAFPWEFLVSGSVNSVISSNGTVQHPEVENMLAEEYDAFIEDPVSTILENIHPRILNSMKTDDALEKRIAALRVYEIDKTAQQAFAGILAKQNKAYGYMAQFAGGPAANIPFDYLADYLRGFQGALIDLRRYPDKVKKACEALMKIIKWSTNVRSTIEDGVSWLPLHMPSFMNTKQFEEFYWDDFDAFLKHLNNLGWHCNMFIEGNWDRYYDYLDRLPHYKTSFQMEEGDPARAKETFGKHHVFGGFYDPTITLVYDKEKCIDEAKRLIDVCGKDGGFYFCFNKNVIDIKSIDVSKLAAVLEWVRDKAVY